MFTYEEEGLHIFNYDIALFILNKLIYSKQICVDWTFYLAWNEYSILIPRIHICGTKDPKLTYDLSRSNSCWCFRQKFLTDLLLFFIETHRNWTLIPKKMIKKTVSIMIFYFILNVTKCYQYEYKIYSEETESNQSQTCVCIHIPLNLTSNEISFHFDTIS